ncbi:MAG: poly-gamma-glutamate biosynthesis protein PgsC [Akkermansiaceae bacterium]|nr:poly-gamma-glutamate biosynthesis protein PgsC [Akkermansiaceae bacterium]
MDPEILTTAIGIGLLFSLLFSELFGLAAGGLVVLGYIALFWREPIAIVFTLAIAFATHIIVQLIGTGIILFGKRRTVLVILVAYLLRLTLDFAAGDYLAAHPAFRDTGVVVIGYIIPGLIAIWFDRQGILETLTTLIAASVVVRVIIILIFGNAILAV